MRILLMWVVVGMVAGLAGCAGPEASGGGRVWPVGLHQVAEDQGWVLERGRLAGRESGAMTWVMCGDGKTVLATEVPVRWREHISFGAALSGTQPREWDEVDNHVYVYDLRTGWRDGQFDGMLYGSLQASRDGRVVVEWGGDGVARVWDVAREKLAAQIAVAKRPRNMILKVSGDGALAFFEVDDGERFETKMLDLRAACAGEAVQLQPMDVKGVSDISPDHTLLMTGRGLWSMAEGRLIPPKLEPREILEHQGYAFDARFVPSGKGLVGESSGYFFDVMSHKELPTSWRGGDYYAVSPDCRWIISRKERSEYEWILRNAATGDRVGGFRLSTSFGSETPTWLADGSGVMWLNNRTWETTLVRLPKETALGANAKTAILEK